MFYIIWSHGPGVVSLSLGTHLTVWLGTDWALRSSHRARDLQIALRRPVVGGGAGHTHCGVTHTYWVMINHPIRRTGSHNSLLIVSSPTPAIVTLVWAIIEIPSGWHRQCCRGRLGTICPRDILRLTYLISINRFEAGWVSFNGRILADNADMSH